MRYIINVFILLFATANLYGQGFAVNTDGSTAHPTAMLDVKSTNKGILIPRMTSAQRLAIPFGSLTSGLLVYDMDANAFSYFNGFYWSYFNNSYYGNLWAQNLNDLYNTNSGNIGIGTFYPAAKLHVAEGSLLFSETKFNLSLATPVPVSGEGLRTMWFHARAAFRSGGVEAPYEKYWDRDSIGEYSQALGLNVKAKGSYSFAQGYRSESIGINTFATGSFAKATADNSFAAGNLVTANGAGSFALGIQTISNGIGSFALGTGATSNGDFSFGLGYATNANGAYSTALGVGLNAYSFGETAIGLYNTDYTPVSTTAWSATDQLFTIGNGTFFNARSNAFTILKNGNTGIGNITPVYRLDVNGRMRIRSDGGNSAGIWFNNYANTLSPGFVGMESDGAIGFYGNGTPNGWGVVMNIATGNVGIGTSIPSQKLHVIGNILATGTITPSDLRFKSNLQPIQSPLSKLLLLNGVTYFMNRSAFPEWNFDSTLQYGVIAQEVEQLFPEMVSTINDKGYKGVNYVKLIPVLIEGFKEMNNKIEVIEKENQSLKEQMFQLIKRMEAMEKNQHRININH